MKSSNTSLMKAYSSNIFSTTDSSWPRNYFRTTSWEVNLRCKPSSDSCRRPTTRTKRVSHFFTMWFWGMPPVFSVFLPKWSIRIMDHLKSYSTIWPKQRSMGVKGRKFWHHWLCQIDLSMLCSIESSNNKHNLHGPGSPLQCLTLRSVGMAFKKNLRIVIFV